MVPSMLLNQMNYSIDLYKVKSKYFSWSLLGTCIRWELCVLSTRREHLHLHAWWPEASSDGYVCCIRTEF